jgi:polysaccharide chain length determinant protein (PEP-CTERM system associated)
VYQSETLILVEPQRVPESYVRSTVTARIEDRLRSIGPRILSHSRLERIVLDFNLYAERRKRVPMEDVVSSMAFNDVDVLVERGDTFRIRYRYGDPRVAQKVTERLASLFIGENTRDREVLAEGTNQFLDAQLEDARRRLIEQEKKLEQYRRQYAGQLPSQVQTNMQAISNIQIQLQAVDNELSRDRERRLELERQMGDLQSSPVEDLPTTATLAQQPSPTASLPDQLDDAHAQLRQLELRYKPDHPDIQTAKRRIRDLEAKIATEAAAPATATQARPVRTAEATRLKRIQELREQMRMLDSQINRRQEEEQRLRGTMAQYQAKVDSAPSRESELVELTRDYTTLQNSYTSLRAKSEDARISANLERRQIGEQFKVLDPARVPERPVSPNRLRLNLMFAFAGLALGLGLFGLLEYRDTALRTGEQVVRVLELPVLALVPMMHTERERERQRWQMRAAAVAVVLMALVGATVLVTWKLRAL